MLPGFMLLNNEFIHCLQSLDDAETGITDDVVVQPVPGPDPPPTVDLVTGALGNLRADPILLLAEEMSTRLASIKCKNMSPHIVLNM